jgi:Tfp pilus assembly protein PilF
VRVVLVIASLAAAAFLVVQERGARAAAAIENIALAPTGVPPARQVAATRAKLAAAERWNPDTTPRVDIGVLEIRARQYRAAGADLSAAVRQEPENANAWALLAFAAQHYDSGLAARARARDRALEPPVPSAR